MDMAVLSWHIFSWRRSCRKWACWGVFCALWDQLLLCCMHPKRNLLVLYKKYGNWPFNLVFCQCFVDYPLWKKCLMVFSWLLLSAFCIQHSLVLYCAPRHGQTNILVYTGICSIVGSLTVSDSTQLTLSYVIFLSFWIFLYFLAVDWVVYHSPPFVLSFW